MHAQPGGSNHNLRVSGTQCVDGAIILQPDHDSGLLDHGRVDDSLELNSNTSRVVSLLQLSLWIYLSVPRWHGRLE